MARKAAIFYPKIRQLRRMRDRSQEETANELGMALGTYNQKEQGIREFSFTEILMLAEFLKCDLNELRGD